MSIVELITYKNMPRATLFDVTTGRKKVVEAGSPNAFAVSPEEQKQGITAWKLETPTQTYDTYQSPQREILQGPGQDLYARDETGTLKIPSPNELSRLVNEGGYQDTRAPYDPNAPGGAQIGAGAGAGADLGAGAGERTLDLAGGPGGAGAGAGVGGAQQGGNPYLSYNMAVMGLLQGLKTGGDKDLLEERNKLIQARFKAGDTETPDEFKMLTPSQQRSLRQQTKAGYESQLAGVDAAIKSRRQERSEAFSNSIQMLDRVNDAYEKTRKWQKEDRDDARASAEFMFSNMGTDWVSELTSVEKSNLEQVMGLPEGGLEKMQGFLKDQAEADEFQFIKGSQDQVAGIFNKTTGDFTSMSDVGGPGFRPVSGSDGGYETGNRIDTGTNQYAGTIIKGTDIGLVMEAIAELESGGNYDAEGPVIPSGRYAGDHAYGKYQVMGFNIPSWTEQALGRSMTPQEFLKDKDAQDAVARHFMGATLEQYGTLEDVASVWFTGQPASQGAGRSDLVTGMGQPAYLNTVRRHYDSMKNSYRERMPVYVDNNGRIQGEIPSNLNYATARQILEASYGEDNKANTDLYKALREEWKKTGADKNQTDTNRKAFDDYFLWMLNPNDPTAQDILRRFDQKPIEGIEGGGFTPLTAPLG